MDLSSGRPAGVKIGSGTVTNASACASGGYRAWPVLGARRRREIWTCFAPDSPRAGGGLQRVCRRPATNSFKANLPSSDGGSRIAWEGTSLVGQSGLPPGNISPYQVVSAER
jgi:hypothetical protein